MLMSRSFRRLLFVLFGLLVLGIWLWVLGVRSSPYALPFVSSM